MTRRRRKRIGVTQRVESLASWGERRDCLDQMWADFLQLCEFTPVPLMNRIEDPSAYLNELEISGLILTGGNDLEHLPGAVNIAAERDRFETAAVDWAVENAKSVLGVCRGLQLLNVHFGGEVVALEGHAGLRHDVAVDGEVSERNSFHNFGIQSEGLANCLEAFAVASDDTVEGFRHRHYPIVAVMWHPERERPFATEDVDFVRGVFGDGAET